MTYDNRTRYYPGGGGAAYDTIEAVVRGTFDALVLFRWTSEPRSGFRDRTYRIEQVYKRW